MTVAHRALFFWIIILLLTLAAAILSGCTVDVFTITGRIDVVPAWWLALMYGG